MLPEQLPACIFGHTNWKPGGAQLGPGYDQEWFTCQDCGLTALYFSEDGGNVFLILQQLDGDRLPREISTWLNDTLRIFWRANAAEIKKVRDAIETVYWDRACEAVGVPLKTPWHKVPEDKQEKFREICVRYTELSKWHKPHGVDLSPIPPKLPVGVTCFIIKGRDGDKFNWKWVSHEETSKIKVPPDPVRVQHDAYFNEVFQTLEKELGIELAREEVPNQYCGFKAQPWFRFKIGGNTFVVGPRKRVDAILIESPSGLVTDGIRKVALDEDNVTYLPNGKWHGTDAVAKTLEVHAWTKEKLIQYLTILGKASLPVSAN